MFTYVTSGYKCGFTYVIQILRQQEATMLMELNIQLMRATGSGLMGPQGHRKIKKHPTAETSSGFKGILPNKTNKDLKFKVNVGCNGMRVSQDIRCPIHNVGSLSPPKGEWEKIK